MKNQVIEITPQEAARNMGFELEHGEFQRSLSTRAIMRVQEIVETSKDELAAANRIIVAFGCTPVLNKHQARIIAKGLAEQLVLKGIDYDAADAMNVVAVKYAKIEREMPWIFTESTTTPLTETPTGADPKRQKERGPKRGGDKKERAFAVYNEMIMMDPKPSDSTIAKEIAKRHEDMSFPNAFYYVTRVFQKKYSGKGTQPKSGIVVRRSKKAKK